jgi:2-iminobutanoate/2-iminopropanoate deaminase
MAPNLGPFSQAVVANGFVFTTGQVPCRSSWDDQPEAFGDKVRQVLANLKTVLEAAGSDLEHIIKVNGYLTDVAQLAEYNRIYAETLGEHLPARTTCVVNMGDIALEIECVAAVREQMR